MMRSLSFSLAVLLVALAAGCGSDDTTTTPTPVTGPFTLTWASNFGPKGSAARQFTATQSGTVTVTLGTLTPSLDAVGVGFGVPDSASGGCALTQQVTGVPGTDPLITATVTGAGEYCVKIFDSGLATLNEAFTMSIVYP